MYVDLLKENPEHAAGRFMTRLGTLKGVLKTVNQKIGKNRIAEYPKDAS